jgi:hypothetical protein
MCPTVPQTPIKHLKLLSFLCYIIKHSRQFVYKSYELFDSTNKNEKLFYSIKKKPYMNKYYLVVDEKKINQIV